MDTSYAFTVWLECGCGEKICCCGVGGYEQIEFPDEEGGYQTDYQIWFSPRYFFRPMRIFPLPPRCPATVTEEVHRSFAVLFCDTAAAANHIRQCVEKILEHSGIVSRGPQGEFIRLQDRIEEFRLLNPENSERASALRWIGNFGSHPEPLTRNDLFDAYDILEVLLEDLFVGHQRSVRQIVEQINVNRGPRRRTQ